MFIVNLSPQNKVQKEKITTNKYYLKYPSKVFDIEFFCVLNDVKLDSVSQIPWKQ